jgi:pimeloyl-ACP methyl ester carboxylesterase
MTTIPAATVWSVDPGLDIHVREAGRGDPVLVLHASAGPRSVDELLTHLADRYHTIAPTHPGFDGTDRLDQLTSVADLADAYTRLLERFTPTRAAVIGISFGGWIAAEMAVTDTARRIDRLVLIDAIGPHIPGHPIAVPAPPAGADPPARGPTPAALAALRAYSGPTLTDPTLLDRVRRVTTPALLLWGQHDPVVPPDYGHEYAAAFPNGSFHLIPGGGHLPMREAPEATYAAIDAFLNDQERTTP